ncbi:MULTISPECIES: polyhydroxyalkanoate synthesis repressor PhaR [unclassified Beijerinckia]|uniref:polyhydroxyalkanoate synthesis repressor PhaR n=1 Tax=unclassified Beijerinckia TaxID=2638183 RepID=UPI00089B5598|nr:MULTISPECIES: polyhydroxyalkanoate synthesis repressor PhaR [unclassified Beijerinckia]MDH7799696.1 polyhydroxyalkanoate synthesis repressor PhaR [Beijerinckia sp. GAS462]SEB49633.1 polyhydroxyalkanoate synthesis repressor PhaR [Beijerinckia sp. 28-YEA-48]
MTDEKQPIKIKKYANRRLYNTGTSTYVTLEDLAKMVKEGDDFAVYDAKTGEDITRPVLTQIIFEQEGKDGQNLLPTNFLRQLIRFYGDSMQLLVPRYLEFSFGRFVEDQQKMRESVRNSIGAGQGTQIFDAMEEQTRKNLAMFSQALGMFNPFGLNPAANAAANAAAKAATSEPAPAAPESAKSQSDLDTLKKQIEEMQKRLEAIDKR